jgi:hypothetical protein
LGATCHKHPAIHIQHSTLKRLKSDLRLSAHICGKDFFRALPSPPESRPPVKSPAATRRKRSKKPRLALIEKAYPGGKSLEFPGMQGRRLEKIELITAGDYHAVSIRFQEKITLHLVIDPGFTLKANLRDWRDGNGRSIKSWPPIISSGMRLR